jgi:hypothetical protein
VLGCDNGNTFSGAIGSAKHACCASKGSVFFDSQNMIAFEPLTVGVPLLGVLDSKDIFSMGKIKKHMLYGNS